ncbi:MAG: DUF6634 family protein [Kiloniellaceae bacterium]
MTDRQDRKRRAEDIYKVLVRIYRGESPTDEEIAAAPRLDFWTVGADDGCLVLQGLVTGHPLLEEGAYIQTSALMWLSDDRKVARTVSRF